MTNSRPELTTARLAITAAHSLDHLNSMGPAPTAVDLEVVARDLDHLAGSLGASHASLARGQAALLRGEDPPGPAVVHEWARGWLAFGRSLPSDVELDVMAVPDEQLDPATGEPQGCETAATRAGRGVLAAAPFG